MMVFGWIDIERKKEYPHTGEPEFAHNLSHVAGDRAEILSNDWEAAKTFA
jgi:hypothetical protein